MAPEQTKAQRDAKKAGDKIRARREELKLSLGDVTGKTGIARANLSRIETGLNKNPTMSTLQRIARALGLDVAEILT